MVPVSNSDDRPRTPMLKGTTRRICCVQRSVLHVFMRLAGPQGVHGTAGCQEDAATLPSTHVLQHSQPQVPTLRREQSAEADGARGCIRGPCSLNIEQRHSLRVGAHNPFVMTWHHPMHPHWRDIAPRPALSRSCDSSRYLSHSSARPAAYCA